MADAGSFRDLHDNNKKSGVTGNNKSKRGTTANRSPISAAVAASGGFDANPTAMNNYSTFSNDQGVQTLLHQSDRIEQSKRAVHESEEVARNVLIDLELQRSQLQDTKGMVRETTNLTGEVRTLLQKIADQSFRRKIFLWLIIVLLAVTDITVFYILFLRRR